MNRDEIIDWLFKNGNPIIRYRVATELCDKPEAFDLEKLEKELHEHEKVKYWLGCITGKTGHWTCFHNSPDTCFENYMGVLNQFGVKAGMPVLDKKMEVYLDWLEKRLNLTAETLIPYFYLNLAAAFLTLTGYSSREWLQSYIINRIDMLCKFATKNNYNIYVDKSKYKRIPKAFQRYSLINPDLYVDGKFLLPWIHDIIMFTKIKKYDNNKSIIGKINSIIKYILHPEYQKFPQGYGIIQNEPGHYYAMGWSVWLPGYFGFEMDHFRLGALVQRVELMSHFPEAVKSKWFVKCLEHLDNFKTGLGTYKFPKQYLKENRNNYFVTGGHMGLGENRRKKQAGEIESTFWMMKIKKNSGLRKQAGSINWT